MSLDDGKIRRLATMLDGRLEAKLTQALMLRASIVALTRDEKAAVLAALERAPGDLAEIREILLADETWQLRQRL